MTRILTGIATVVVLAVLSPMGSAVAVESPTPSPVTWSVRPGNAAGVDGRAWVEQTLSPGESRLEYLVLHNLSSDQVTFSLTAADGYFTDEGRFNMLPANQKSVAAGTWISIAPSATAGPDETVIVPFTTVVPPNAEPGDHAAGVAASVTAAASGSGGAGVGINGRVGFRVMTRVTGALTPAAEIADLSTAYQTAWNPFAPGQVATSFTLSNTGNTRLVVNGELNVGGVVIAYPDTGTQPQELLPGESRRFSLSAKQIWPLFAVPVDVTAQLAGIGLDGTETAPTTAHAAGTVLAIPLPQLILLVGVALVILGLSWSRSRSRRHVQNLVARAREEGIREASVGHPVEVPDP